MKLDAIPSYEFVQLLSKLAFTKEEKLLTSKIELLNRNAKLQLMARTWSYALFSITYVTFISLIGIHTFHNADFMSVALAALTIFSGTFIVADLFFAKTINTYHRMVSAILTNLLEVIFFNYRLSLGDMIATLPNSKKFTHEISAGILNSMNFQTNVVNMLTVFVGFIVNIIVYIISRSTYSFVLLITNFVVFFQFLLIIYNGYTYKSKSADLAITSDSFDNFVKNSKAIVVQPHVQFVDNELEARINAVAKTTTYINFGYGFFMTFMPIVTLFTPLIFTEMPKEFYLGLFLINLILRTGPIITNYTAISQGNQRLKSLQNILEQIANCETEMTPLKYDSIKRGNMELCTFTSQKNVAFCVKKTSYMSGRAGQKSLVTINNIELPPSKISFLHGKSGAGKSIFARMITLRYSDFKGEFIGKFPFDIRNFNDLFEGRNELIYSSMREIDTSYRAAISLYFDLNLRNNIFLRDLQTQLADANYLHEARNHILHSSYYDHTIGEELKHIPSPFSTILRPELQTYVQNLYLRIHQPAQFRNYTNFLKSALTTSEYTNVVVVSAVAEYYAFSHLKKYIPEASHYFMDAILSEPPISQGQRRRIIYALDILFCGSLFVIDEPTSNLDLDTYKNIFTDISRYAEQNSACVLVIEPHLSNDIVDHVRSLNTLGNIYQISQVQEGYKIAQSKDHD